MLNKMFFRFSFWPNPRLQLEKKKKCIYRAIVQEMNEADENQIQL